MHGLVTASAQDAPLQGGRRIQLDGLRCLAVLGVMVGHFLDPEKMYGRFGGWGVQTFFVLSGFLIGGILLEARQRIAKGRQTLGRELGNFYARRTLRIFPAFYLLVVTTYLLGNWSSAPFEWIALYAVNIWEVIHCEIAGVFGHIYTLCIEEHFYLLFPLLVLLTPGTKLNFVLACLVGFAVCYRFVVVDTLQICNATRLVFSELDSLGGGALIAALVRSGFLAPGSLAGRRFAAVAAACGAAYFANFYANLLWDGGIRSSALSGFLFVVFAGWVVYRASFGFGGAVGALLSWKPFVYLGTISYGLYLYHNFAGWFIFNAAKCLGVHEPLPIAVAFLLQLAWTVAVASLSWFVLEAPCNRAKRFFSSDARTPS